MCSIPVWGSLAARAGRGVTKTSKVALGAANAVSGGRTVVKELELTISALGEEFEHCKKLLQNMVEDIKKTGKAILETPISIRIERVSLQFADGGYVGFGGYRIIINFADDVDGGGRTGKVLGGGLGGGSKPSFNTTPELEAHIRNTDPSVPRRRGIGGAHNSTEFFQHDVEIIRETPSKIPGVSTVEYRMPKLNPDGTPTGEYGTKVLKKTIYNPEIISDDEFIKRGLEAANDAISKSSDGIMPREWIGVDSKGISWHGYYENGEITSFFPDE